MELRTATPADAPAIRTLLAHSYRDDPLMKWVFPDVQLRLESIAIWLGTYLDRYLAAGDVYVAGDFVGVAAWRREAPACSSLPTAAGALAAIIGVDQARRYFEAMSLAVGLRPTQPASYLHLLGVAAEHRRNGVGTALVSAGLERARTEHRPLVVETTAPQNLPFFERLGFGVLARTPLPGDVSVWLLQSV